MLEPEERVAAPDERLVEPDDLVVVPDERVEEPERVETPDERLELELPLLTVDDLREPEEVAVPALERVVLPEFTVLRELVDLDDAELVAARVIPVEASLEPTDLLETDLVPADSATALVEALFTAAETPSTLREEPVVAKEPERDAEVAPAPARVVPPLRPYTISFLRPPPSR